MKSVDFAMKKSMTHDAAAVAVPRAPSPSDAKKERKFSYQRGHATRQAAQMVEELNRLRQQQAALAATAEQQLQTERLFAEWAKTKEASAGGVRGRFSSMKAFSLLRRKQEDKEGAEEKEEEKEEKEEKEKEGGEGKGGKGAAQVPAAAASAVAQPPSAAAAADASSGFDGRWLLHAADGRYRAAISIGGDSEAAVSLEALDAPTTKQQQQQQQQQRRRPSPPLPGAAVVMVAGSRGSIAKRIAKSSGRPSSDGGGDGAGDGGAAPEATTPAGAPSAEGEAGEAEAGETAVEAGGEAGGEEALHVFEHLDRVTLATEKRMEVWAAREEWARLRGRWLETTWRDLDVGEAARETRRFARRVKRLARRRNRGRAPSPRRRSLAAIGGSGGGGGGDASPRSQSPTGSAGSPTTDGDDDADARREGEEPEEESNEEDDEGAEHEGVSTRVERNMLSQLVDELDDFLGHLPLLERLGAATMRTAHWVQVRWLRRSRSRSRSGSPPQSPTHTHTRTPHQIHIAPPHANLLRPLRCAPLCRAFLLPPQLFDALDFGLARKAAAGKSVARSTGHLDLGSPGAGGPGGGGGGGGGGAGAASPSPSPSPRAQLGGRGAMAAGSLNLVVDQIRSAGGTRQRERAPNLGEGALARFKGHASKAKGLGGSGRGPLANAIVRRGR